MRFYAVGLRNTAVNSQAESYRMLTGPRAERAVTPGDGRAYVQGHYFGSGLEDGERETIGASSNSRIWSNQRLSVSQYLEWISKLNNRLNGDETLAESQLDLVQHSRTLRRIPDVVIGGSWSRNAYKQAHRLASNRLLDEDVENPGWDGCEIGREFDADNPERMTVHRHLELWIRAKENLEVLVYDHRTGEAAEYIAVTREEDDRVLVSLYHCKGAGGEPNGARVDDVYEVTCQLLKSVVYCESRVLVEHVEHRINERRHRRPSVFKVGNLAMLQEILLNRSADKVSFAIYGVQPGISKGQIDAHLADLMAFSIDYVKRGGAAVGKWLVNA